MTSYRFSAHRRPLSAGIRFLVFAIALTLFLGAITVTQAQDSLTDQTLFLTFVPNVQFAPVYAALENGHFTDARLNVNIEHGDENVGVDLIAANERQFGLISGEEVIKARANGRPVVYVYEWFQQYPVGIVVPADSEIMSVSDLRGHKVGIPGRFGASYNGLTALLSANGLTENDIQLEVIGFTAPEAVCVGYESNYAQGVEAAVVYLNNEPLQIAAKCTPVRVFPVADAVDMVSNGLVTNEATIQNSPDLVQAMVTAFDGGLRDVINNPAEAYLLSASYVDNLPLSDDFKAALEIEAASQTEWLTTNPDHTTLVESRLALRERLEAQFDMDTLLQFEVLLNTIDFWDADQLGYSDLSSWEVTQDTLTMMGFLPGAIDLEAAFTNAFLPAPVE
ncbi:MAG: ABC transporter substrate-binding protein [Anaerolineaceae bacterium]|nr:ABC transporter substrate-binding protein [Anaerolineaceae bacterium]